MKEADTIINLEEIHRTLFKWFGEDNLPLRTSDKLLISHQIREITQRYDIGENRTDVSGPTKQIEIAVAVFDDYLREYLCETFFHRITGKNKDGREFRLGSYREFSPNERAKINTLQYNLE
jgi:hypothetical protein